MSKATPQLPAGTWLWLHDFTRWIGTWCFYVGYRLRVWHRERIPAQGPVVVVANHSAMVDGPLLYGLLRRRACFLVKEEMFRGLLRWLLPRLGQLAVRRGSGDRAPLLIGAELLRSDGMVVVFPEGTRGEGNVRRIRHGAAWLAHHTDAQLLPVAIRGTRRPSARGTRRFRPRVDVLVGEPFCASDGTDSTASETGADGSVDKRAVAATTEEIRKRLAALVAELDEIRGETRNALPGVGAQHAVRKSRRKHDDD